MDVPDAMYLVEWDKMPLQSVGQTRMALPLTGVEYLVVTRAPLKIRCVLSIFVFVSIKYYQTNLILVSIAL